MSKELYAISTLIGTIIGAGMLGIPYAINRSGFFFGILNIVLIGLFVMLLNLQLGEVILRTHGRHQLTGYAKIYIGRWGKAAMAVAMMVGIYGALIAYLIGEGEAFASLFGGNPVIYSTIFFLIASTLLFFGIKTISKSEFYFSLLKFTVLFALIVLLLPHIRIENIPLAKKSLLSIVYPFGVVVFAFLGLPAIPELKEILLREEKKMLKVILLASTVPIILYVLFAFVFVSALGNNISEIATVNLVGRLRIIGDLFTIFLMTTPFLALGLALQEMYEYDYGFSRKKAFFLSCIVPYLVFLLGTKSFIRTTSIAGAITGTLYAILIIMMFWKAKSIGKRQPEYSIPKTYFLEILIVLVFVIASFLSLFPIEF